MEININDINSMEDVEKLNLTFEDAYRELEKIIELQQKELISLNDSIRYYKIGNILAKYCQNLLENAKLEINELPKD